MAKRYKEYVFVQYKQVDVIHPMHGKISETRNYELSSEMFILLSKTKTHILIKNANPHRQIFPKPEILPLEIVDVNIVPGQFAMQYLKEIERLSAEVRRFRARQRKAQLAGPVAVSLPQNHSLLNLLRMGGRKPGDQPPDSAAPGSTADLPPKTPAPSGGESKS
jgi:hypothetical protein